MKITQAERYDPIYDPSPLTPDQEALAQQSKAVVFEPKEERFRLTFPMGHPLGRAFKVIQDMDIPAEDRHRVLLWIRRNVIAECPYCFNPSLICYSNRNGFAFCRREDCMQSYPLESVLWLRTTDGRDLIAKEDLPEDIQPFITLFYGEGRHYPITP